MKKSSAPAPAPAADNPMAGRIVTAAFEAFMENGYSETSTLEIATRARVSKRDLYANFPSKQAILAACVANRAARMRLSPDLPEPRSREMLASTLASFGATVIREVCHPQVVAVFRLAIAEAERSPEVAEVLNVSRSASRTALAALFAQAQRNGILRDGDQHDMVEQFFGLLWGDLQLNRLLNAATTPRSAEIDKRAQAATQAFLALHQRQSA
jgi:AcrR family transcriptional regulator